MNRPKIVVKNGLKPIKQAKTKYLKRKPARERGLFGVEILGMQYGISVLKRRGWCVIIRYLDYSFLCS